LSWYSARVLDNRDPDQRGGLRLLIPALLGPEAAWPGWVPATFAGAAPGAVSGLWIPPPGALVQVRVLGELATWSGATLAQDAKLPEALRRNYPRRSGSSSTDGRSVILLEDGTSGGLLVLVPDGGTMRLGSETAAKHVQLAEAYLERDEAWRTWAATHIHPHPVVGPVGVSSVPPPISGVIAEHAAKHLRVEGETP
jgi:hypothetical protein